RDESLVAFRLFDRVQVGALEVLDERQREQRLIVNLLHDGRNLRPAEAGRGSVAALAGDELVASASGRGSDGDRLQQAARLEARLQISQFLGAELLAGLVGIGPYLPDRDVLERARVTRRRRGLRCRVARREQR